LTILKTGYLAYPAYRSGGRSGGLSGWQVGQEIRKKFHLGVKKQAKSFFCNIKLIIFAAENLFDQ